MNSSSQSLDLATAVTKPVKKKRDKPPSSSKSMNLATADSNFPCLFSLWWRKSGNKASDLVQDRLGFGNIKILRLGLNPSCCETFKGKNSWGSSSMEVYIVDSWKNIITKKWTSETKSMTHSAKASNDHQRNNSVASLHLEILPTGWEISFGYNFPHAVREVDTSSDGSDYVAPGKGNSFRMNDSNAFSDGTRMDWNDRAGRENMGSKSCSFQTCRLRLIELASTLL